MQRALSPQREETKHMKKSAFWEVLFIVLFLSACASSGNGKKQTYSDRELDGVRLTITRTENGVLYYKLESDEAAGLLTTGNGQEAILERWEGNEWRQMTPNGDFAWTMEAYGVSPQNPWEGSLSVERKYGNLLSGRYRLIKPFTASGGGYSAKAEFDWK